MRILSGVSYDLLNFVDACNPARAFSKYWGVILVLRGRNVKHLVVTWVGFCVGEGRIQRS